MVTPAASARVLLTTVFGDSLLPRGQAVGVQQLAALVEPLGINERSVRTSLHRLGQEGLVQSEKQGRQSFYRVADEALPIFADANERIYRHEDPPWDGEWTVAMVANEDNGVVSLRDEFHWMGMAQLSPAVFVSPTRTPSEVADVASRHNVALLLLSRGPQDAVATINGENLAGIVAPLPGLREEYLAHLAAFGSAREASLLGPADAFRLRTLLIDSWRRLALRDLSLPSALLPPDWPALDAFELTMRLRADVEKSSEAHLDAVLGPA
ncbi:MAG: hypothetical protein EX269_04860 [Acidimicrobiales bacterium]|nr:MAG: hypothetical protein EX269_04860 [Acidimicrobiales bacterium]